MTFFNKIAVSGKIGSGKTTVSNYYADTKDYNHIRSAKHLKLLCELIAKRNLFTTVDPTFPTFSIDHSINEIIEFISNDELEYKSIHDHVQVLSKEFSHVTNTLDKTDNVRKMLQTVANRLIDNVREDIWVSAAIKDMNNLNHTTGSELFVHDDLRYPFEYDALRREGFVLIRLNISPEVQNKRIKRLYGNIDPERLIDISEVALDNHVFDYTIDADQPLDSMLDEIEKLIKN